MTGVRSAIIFAVDPRARFISNATVNQDGTEIDELSNGCFGGASRKLQGPIGIEGTVNIDRIVLAAARDPGCRMDYDINIHESFGPISLRADGRDNNRIRVENARRVGR
jgi:hypothetical protein